MVIDPLINSNSSTYSTTIYHFRSFSNVNFTKPSEPSGVSGVSLKSQHSMILQDDHEMSMTTPMYDNFFLLTNVILLEKYVLETHFTHVIAQDINFNIRPTPQHTLSKEICNTSSKISVHKNQSNLYSELDYHVSIFLNQ